LSLFVISLSNHQRNQLVQGFPEVLGEVNVSSFFTIHSSAVGKLFRRGVFAGLLLVGPVLPSVAAEAPVETSSTDAGVNESPRAPVILDGNTLFMVRGVSAFPAGRRASEIAARIEKVAANPAFDPSMLKITELPDASAIVAGDQRIVVIFDADALIESADRGILAQVYLMRIREAIAKYRQDRTPKALIRDASYIAAASLALAVFIWLVRRAKRRLDALLERRLRARLEGLESQSYQIVRAKHLWSALRGTSRGIWLAAIALGGLFYLNFALSLLPWTRLIGDHLFDLLIEPLRVMGMGLLREIPALSFLVVLFFVTRFIIKALQIFFSGVADGAIKLQNFDADWAWPTHRLLRLLVIAFAIVVAFPYIPGSGSDAFKGVSLFLGVVFSLGSSSVISNVIAGYTMTYRRAFKQGDRIQIGEHIGDVTEVRQLVTHLRTPKNEEIVVPNSLILNSSVVNYSTLARHGQLMLHTTVGIGYETPWRQVEAMLLQAANKTQGILKEPAPFVLQKALGDFCVNYEINVFCDNAQAMNRLYTALHQNILDVFNEYGVQIMTPNYESDPAQAKVVPRDQWFLPPARPVGE
jgi:small-conductance mechanosensitive channel